MCYIKEIKFACKLNFKTPILILFSYFQLMHIYIKSDVEFILTISRDGSLYPQPPSE